MWAGYSGRAKGAKSDIKQILSLGRVQARGSLGVGLRGLGVSFISPRGSRRGKGSMCVLEEGRKGDMGPSPRQARQAESHTNSQWHLTSPG